MQAATFDGNRRPYRGHLHHLLFDEDAAAAAASGARGVGASEEYSEADVLWGGVGGSTAAASPDRAANPSPPARSSSLRKPRRNVSAGRPSAVPASMPVQIPDWSKILGAEAPAARRHPDMQQGSCGSVGYCEGGGDDEEDDDDEDEEDEDGRRHGVIPPHEYLWRRRRGASVAAAGGAAFSLCEGIGRTLKGRDLSRVRNAVWEKIGFQD